MTTHRIGDITITRIEEQMGPGFPANGLLPDWDPAILAEHGGWLAPNYYQPESGRFVSSIHSWVIKTKHHTILVDTCCGNGKNRPGSDRFHMLNTPYLQRLAAAGVQSEDVDYVLCTHLHVDHVGWNTQLLDGRWVPTFPNARYVMSKTERDHWDPSLNPSLKAGQAEIFTDSVLPVIAAGQAMVVAMTDQIGDGLLIAPAPGHAPGHIMLRLLAGGQEGIFIGDVMHHPSRSTARNGPARLTTTRDRPKSPAGRCWRTVPTATSTSSPPISAARIPASYAARATASALSLLRQTNERRDFRPSRGSAVGRRHQLARPRRLPNQGRPARRAR